MRFIVYGAGAVGGVLGARLQLAGADAQFVARGAHLAALRDRGLKLVTPEGETTLPVRAAATVAELDLGGDPAQVAVLVAVKGQDTAAVLADLDAHAHGDVTVVSLQNGVANERALLRGFAHVLSVCVMLPASHLEAGEVIQTSAPVPGMLDVGRFPSGVDQACEDFAAAVRSAGFHSVVRPDVMAWKYRKLIANLGNAVSATCAPGADRDRLTALARAEGERILAVAGIEVVTAEQDTERRGSLLSPDAIGGRGGGSTWQSLRRGTGAVETDYLNGEITLLGRLHAQATPVNDLLARTAATHARARSAPGTLSAAELLAGLPASTDTEGAG